MRKRREYKAAPQRKHFSVKHARHELRIPAVRALWAAGVLSLIASFALVAPVSEKQASAENKSAIESDLQTYIIPIQDTIDLGLAYFIKRSLDEAERGDFAAVILDVDTLGGRVDAALDIRDALEGSKLPVTAYVNKRAISAGALICLATKNIAMAPGSTIGAATPISIGPLGEAGKLSEKEVSYVRSEFRATAERNGHSPLLAEAMVDADTEVYAVYDGAPTILSAEQVQIYRKQHKGVEVEAVSPKGKLLTLTSSEAKRIDLAESTPESVDGLIQSLGLNPDNTTISVSTWSEKLVRFITHPIVSGLLLTFGVLGIFFELQIPGWGISGTAGVICLALFFGGHYLAGLASVVDILLFVVGLALLAFEVFVIPGFGVAGISGILCLLLSIYLALVKRPIPQFSWDFQRMNTALFMVLLSLVSITFGMIIIWKIFPHTRWRNRLVLTQSEEASLGYTSGENMERLIGSVGTSLTKLRPIGKALIDQQPLEVQTMGEFIEKDRNVRVVKVIGNKVFVAEQTENES